MDIILNTGMTISVNTSAAAEKVSDVQETQNVGKSAEDFQTETKANYDTVELSDEARNYLTEADNTETDISSEMNLAASTEDDEITSSDLYSYTESELKNLLVNGDITRTEYDAEIAKRSASVSVSDE
ncbi:MAG: hypothetical protein K2O14_13715 [Oscillospiraceae bacterium]|nr:hypothetical protein [Oscillospiraceae bacterium]